MVADWVTYSTQCTTGQSWISTLCKIELKVKTLQSFTVHIWKSDKSLVFATLRIASEARLRLLNFCVILIFFLWPDFGAKIQIQGDLTVSKKWSKSVSKKWVENHTVQNLHFFVQKFNFDFPRKLSIFWGEKLVKMLWFRTF